MVGTGRIFSNLYLENPIKATIFDINKPKQTIHESQNNPAIPVIGNRILSSLFNRTASNGTKRPIFDDAIRIGIEDKRDYRR